MGTYTSTKSGKCIADPIENAIRPCSAYLEQKVAESPVERPIYLLGESMGGIFALAVAAGRADLVDRVVVVNPATSFPNSIWPIVGPIMFGLNEVRAFIAISDGTALSNVWHSLCAIRFLCIDQTSRQISQSVYIQAQKSDQVLAYLLIARSLASLQTEHWPSHHPPCLCTLCAIQGSSQVYCCPENEGCFPALVDSTRFGETPCYALSRLRGIALRVCIACVQMIAGQLV